MITERLLRTGLTAHLLVFSALKLLLLTLIVIGCSQREPTTVVPTQFATLLPTPIPLLTATPMATALPTLTPTPDPFNSDFPLSTVHFTLPPTIRHITQTSAVLFFELDQPTDDILFYQAVGP